MLMSGSVGVFILGTQLSLGEDSPAASWTVHVEVFQLTVLAKFPVSCQHHQPDLISEPLDDSSPESGGTS